MEDLIIGGEYTYGNIIAEAGQEWEMKSYGNMESTIGETFLCFYPNNGNDYLLSFIMIGYTTQGIFRLIYKYIG